MRGKVGFPMNLDFGLGNLAGSGCSWAYLGCNGLILQGVWDMLHDSVFYSVI